MAIKPSISQSGVVTTTDATKTLITSFDMPAMPCNTDLLLRVVARDATGATVFRTLQYGGAQRTSAGVTIDQAPTAIAAPILIGLLAGILTGVGISVDVSGSTIRVWVTGKAASTITWRARVSAMFN